jgi:drug/metabolite transporter (DMT)-like permease
MKNSGSIRPVTNPFTRLNAHAKGSSNLQGLGWMFITGLLFVGVTGIVRHLGSDMHPVQAAFIRYAIGMAFLLPVLTRTPVHRLLSRRLGVHALRGLLHGTGVMLWFYAMTRIPIAEVTALGFTAPIFVTIGAALFLGERLRIRRIVAVLAGFAGALVILRPGVTVVDPGAWAQMAAAPLFACSMLMAKKLTETENSTTIVAYLSIFVTLTLLPGAILVWRTPTLEEMFWLVLVASIATLGHVTMTNAYRLADITVTQPMSFLQLIWATLLGFYVFGEEPDLWTWIGGVIIVASATYIAQREARLNRPRPDGAQVRPRS